MGQYRYNTAGDDRIREQHRKSQDVPVRRLPMIIALLISMAAAYFIISLYLGHPLIQVQI